MEVVTRHEELVYWYTRYEDPNCIAVVELVTTIVDGDSGVQVRKISLRVAVAQGFDILPGIRNNRIIE